MQNRSLIEIIDEANNSGVLNLNGFFPQNPLNSSDAERLAALLTQPHVHTLCLESNELQHFHKKSFHVLLNILNRSQIKTLHLGKNNLYFIDTHTIKIMFQIFAKLNLRALYLDHTGLGFFTIDEFNQFIQNFKLGNLELLDLSYNNLKGFGFDLISSLIDIVSTSSVQNLKLNGNGYEDLLPHYLRKSGLPEAFSLTHAKVFQAFLRPISYNPKFERSPNRGYSQFGSGDLKSEASDSHPIDENELPLNKLLNELKRALAKNRLKFGAKYPLKDLSMFTIRCKNIPINQTLPDDLQEELKTNSYGLFD